MDCQKCNVNYPVPSFLGKRPEIVTQELCLTHPAWTKHRYCVSWTVNKQV